MIKERSLYLVTGADVSAGRTTVEVVKRALQGGVDIVQMREKRLGREGLAALGAELGALCGERGAVFIVNDDPYIARECGASGVHLGQEDLKSFSLTRTREIIGTHGVIGVSTHSYEEFRVANAADVEYIAFGPVFPTKTKDYFIGAGDIERVTREAVKPVFFIGGINEGNIKEILDRGGRNVAVIREITEAADITAKVRRLKSLIGAEKGETA
jgi:thiamine-phosphate pyrophosphorylase